MSSIVIWDRSFIADTGATLVNSDGGASKAGYAAAISAAGSPEPKVILADTDEDALGILQEVNLDGRAVSVRLLGETFVVVGASVVAGNPLKVDGNGRLIPASSGDKALALALDSITLPATPTGNETVNALLRGPFVAV